MTGLTVTPTPVRQPFRTSFAPVSAGAPYDPPKVQLTYTIPGNPTPVVLAPGNAGIVRDSAGNYHSDITPLVPGTYYITWEGQDAGGNPLTTSASEYPVTAVGTSPGAGYPFPYGYCELRDIQARINAGSWTGGTGAFPTAAQGEQFIRESSAQIDLALRHRGYFVPLVPTPPLVVVPPVVFTHLQHVCAALTCAFIERVRHGSAEESADTVADYWMGLADDLIARIESGADDLGIMGISGDFPPVADLSRGMWVGGTVDSLGNRNLPAFTMQNLY